MWQGSNAFSVKDIALTFIYQTGVFHANGAACKNK